MSNEHQVQEREHQRVEHCNWVYVVTVKHFGRSTYAIINGERHKVYPTRNDNEPWTTNIRFSV